MIMATKTRYHLPWLDKFTMKGYIEKIEGCETWYLTYPTSPHVRHWKPITDFTANHFLQMDAIKMEDDDDGYCTKEENGVEPKTPDGTGQAMP